MLENPNSVQQMKDWLADNGLETETLSKKQVAELLKTAPEPLRSVLVLRQQLAKSSVKKYQAMEATVCADGRVRGCFNSTALELDAGLAGIFSFRICPRIRCLIWNRHVLLSAPETMTRCVCSMIPPRMCFLS